MIKNIIEFIRKKHIGVDLFNGELKAFEKDNIYIDKSIEEINPSILNAEDNDSYWYNLNAMKKLLTYVLNSTKKSLFRPILYIAVQFEISESKDRKLIIDAALQSKWGTVYMVDNFLCSAAGSGIRINEPKRKIYVYHSKKTTYIGVIFAGGAFNVKILEKEYNQLTKIDIKNKIEKLLSELSNELPEQFTSVKLPKKDLNEVARGWRLEIERKIYISVPSNLKNKFCFNIGKYQLVYLDYENNILNGLKRIVGDFKSKKSREIKKK